MPHPARPRRLWGVFRLKLSRLAAAGQSASIHRTAQLTSSSVSRSYMIICHSKGRISKRGDSDGMATGKAHESSGGPVLEIGYLADLFDLLNVRDLDVIRQASELCGRLVVGVFTDEYAQQFLGHTPVVPFEERRELVSHVRGVDEARAHSLKSVREAWPTFGLADRPQVVEHAAGPVLFPRRVTASVLLSNALILPDRSVA